MFWPAPSTFASSASFGSLPVPWLWKGPERVTEIGPWVLDDPPVELALMARLSFPDFTECWPENVSLSSWLTSVDDDAESLLPPPQPVTTAMASRVMSRTGAVLRRGNMKDRGYRRACW